MIGKERLERFGEAVEHMREVHKRAVLLNVAVYANWGQLMAEDQWIFGGNHRKATVLSTESTEVLSRAVDHLYTLQSAYEYRAFDGWEVTVNASIRGLENCTCEMKIVERELSEVYPEDVRAILDDWLAKFYLQKTRPLRPRVSENHVSEDEI